LATAAALGCGLAGCSFQLHSLLAGGEADRTGSLGRSVEPAAAAAAPGTAAADLAYARAAAVDALARSGNDQSVPWHNPNTGAGGNITPLSASYREGGRSCRQFLASYAHGGAQDWLTGAACRTGEGEWQVGSLKPLKPS
jgi:surface antigen